MHAVPSPVTVIAEASGNHRQQYALAVDLVHAAAAAGADIIKFQTFTPEEIAAGGIPIPRGHDPAQDAWLARLEVTTLRDLFRQGGLPRAWHKALKREAEASGVEFCSTPFSVNAARFLVEDIGVHRLKIASGDLTFTPLLEYAAQTGLPVIVSTGAATLDEIHGAVSGPLWDVYTTGRLTLLHCRSLYPCPDAAVNLRSVRTLRALYPSAAIGWSDHTVSPHMIPLLAVMCGASVVEKHLRLEGDDTSIDAGHSIAPPAFQQMVAGLRDLPGLLGSSEKVLHHGEAHERLWARRDPSDWLRPTQAARAGRWA